MIKDCLFKSGETTMFLGRNGVFKCTGFTLSSFASENKSLSIWPITSRGTEGRCWIEIPAEDIPQLIEELQIASDILNGKVKP